MNRENSTDPDLEKLVDEMSIEEQVSILSGEDFWSLPAVARLNIGKLRVTDGPNGARGGGSLIGGVTAAAFPIGIALGATWDPELTKKVGVALAQEVKSKGAHVSLAPTVNIQRSVTNGRNFECYAEDPELTAALAVGYIEGLQGEGISATIKHFAGNESEIERTTINSQVDERALREVYLRPFEDAVKKAGTWGIMSSYNKLNGDYTAENEWLLTKVLRNEWAYDGIVMSDWFGSRTTAPTVNAGLDLEMPGPARDRGPALISAVENGEVSRETVRMRALNILRLLKRTGAISDHRDHEEQANDLPEHRALIRRAGAEGAVLLKNDGMLPLSDNVGTVAVIGPNAKVAQIMGGGSAQLNPHYRVSPFDGFAARLGDKNVRHAQGCTNHRWEPLIEETFSVALFDNLKLSGTPIHHQDLHGSTDFWFGMMADGKIDAANCSARISGQFIPSVSGSHSFGLHATGLGRLYVNDKLVVDIWDQWTKGRTFFEEGCDEVTGAIELIAGEAVQITVEICAKPTENLHFTAFRFGVSCPLGDTEIEEAARLAAANDIAVLCVGRSGEWDTEGSDLEDIKLPGRQDELIAAVLKANPKTIIALQTGGPVEMPWVDDAPAILQFWYPGQECGNAIADVIFGDAEPGGRLPQTFPVRWSDNPTHSQDREIYPGLDGTVRYEEGVFIGYRHYDAQGITPLFPFGHGLSYTSFDLSDLRVEPSPDLVRVDITVENTGQRSGSCVVQLYVGDPHSAVTRPIRELKAFRKVHLEAGESRNVQFELDQRAFAYFDVNTGMWRIEEGMFNLEIGFSVADLRLSGNVERKTAQLKP